MSGWGDQLFVLSQLARQHFTITVWLAKIVLSKLSPGSFHLNFRFSREMTMSPIDNSAIELDDHDLDALYNKIRRYSEHQDNLINQRLSWFLTLQGFLFAGFSISVKNSFDFSLLSKSEFSYSTYILDSFLFLFGLIVCSCAMKISDVVRNSIQASYTATACLRDIWRTTIEAYGPLQKKSLNITIPSFPNSDLWSVMKRKGRQVNIKEAQLDYIFPLKGKFPFVHGGGSDLNVLQGVGGAHWIPIIVKRTWQLTLAAYIMFWLTESALYYNILKSTTRYLARNH